MNCSSCQHDNRPGRKFCVSCGVTLPRACPACGGDCEAGENFCGECGEPLTATAPRPRTDTARPSSSASPLGAAPPRNDTARPSSSPLEAARGPLDPGARKVVTIVFADLAGSTALHERVDAESARRLMERYYLALRRAVEAHGGTVVKLLGDGVMAAFGLHQVGEDDALRAVRGAAAMQDAFRALVGAEGEALGAVGLRVAVNTGEVVVAAGEDDVVGDPVNVAARLQEQGRDGDVVLGEATRRLVGTRVTLEPLGSVSLKGRAEAVTAHRLVSLDPPAGATAAPFVGRDAELARLESVFDSAVTTPATRLAVLVGSPGLGKSRLIDELSRRRADDATILAAHCDAAGGATFAPLAQALRGLLGLADGVTGEPLRLAVEAALAGGGSVAGKPLRTAVDAALAGGDGVAGKPPRTAADAALPGADGVARADGVTGKPPRTAALQGADDVMGTPSRTAADAALPGAADVTAESPRIANAAGAERARIAAGIDGLLTGAATSPEETFFVVRRFLAALASTRPVVLVIDDLHWAEPLLLDLVEHLVQWGSGVRLFVLVGARPELRELRSSLVTAGGVVRDVVTLGGLDASAAMRLAAGVLGAADLPAAVAAKVLATSEGNPLFVTELVRMLVQEGALARDGDRWTAGAALAALEMPPTIHALLAARIERLRPEERTVLERAAVVGRHFSRGAVAALLGLPNGADSGELDARLEALRRSELIERDSGWFLGEPALRFHHLLTRDAAYRRLLKGTRTELHSQLAAWIEARVGDAPEHDETIGRHLEQACQLLRELDPGDASSVALGERAARRLAAAGRRALARDDVSLAAGLLGRALALLGPHAHERADLVLDRCEALLAAGDVGPAAETVAELDRMAAQASAVARAEDDAGAANTHAAGTDGIDEAGGAAQPVSAAAAAEPASRALTSARRLRAWHTCFAGQLTVLTAPEALQATAAQVGAAAEELAQLGDAAGEAKAHSVHAQALARLGRIGASEAALDLALAAARRAGDRRRANAVLAGAPLAALWGPSPVTRASGRCLDVVRVLRITQGAPAVEAVALSCQGVLEALRGRIEAARRMLASSRKLVEELGIAHRLHETDVFAGRIDLLEGDAAAAERTLRTGYEGLRDLGLGIDAARAAALLGRALLAQDRAAEAEALSRESESLAGDDLQAAIAWRGVRAEALARRGDHATAIALAKAAVAIAETTDALLDHADARLALAAALRAGGRRTEADAEERRAVELWEAKGAALLADRARSGDAAPAAPLASPAEPGRAAEESFDEAAADGAATTRIRRLVPPNAAIAALQRFREAEAARDLEALDRQMSPDIEVVHHATGATYGRQGMLATWRSMFRAASMERRQEEIATLGEDLAVGRHVITLEGLAEKHVSAFGSVEIDEVVLSEVDATGRIRCFELFPSDRLGGALIRMYERYAERQEDADAGAARRARGMARALSVSEGPIDVDGITAATSESIEVVDHRVLGGWSARSREEWLHHWQAHFGLADDSRGRYDDVFALTPNAILVHQTLSGTDRTSGGKFEFVLLMLNAYDHEGRTARTELFDPGDTAAALARFEQLTSGGALAGRAAAPPAPRTNRAPRANRALRAMRDFEAAFAAGDQDALARLFDRTLVVADHPNGATYGLDGHLASLARLLRTRQPELRARPLATLGENLVLWHRRIRASGTSGGRFDVGEFEREELVIFELGVAETGAAAVTRIEIHAGDRLEQALGRLYSLHAASLPEGSLRTRVAGIASWYLPSESPVPDLEAILARYGKSFVCVDHRNLRTWSARNRNEWADHLRSQFELSSDVTGKVEDLLAFTPFVHLCRRTFGGTIRASGGAFENVYLAVETFDQDGHCARMELFEPEEEAAALARFDELVGSCAGAAKHEEAEHPFANAATRAVARVEHATAARDWESLADIVAVDLDFEDRRALLRIRLGAEAFLQQHRTLFDAPNARWTMTTIATLGERLSLSRLLFLANASDGGGDLEIEHLGVVETGDDGRMRAIVLFEPSDLDAAHAELEARWQAECEAAPGCHAGRLDSSAAAALAARDWDSLAGFFAPTLVARDHRLVGWGELHGPQAFVATMRAMVDLAPDARSRAVHVRDSKRGSLAEVQWMGTHDGGDFESSFLWVVEFDPDGLAQQLDFYDLRHFDKARARFAEIHEDALPQGALTQGALARDEGAPTRDECASTPAVGLRPGDEDSSPDPIAALLRPNLVTAQMARWLAAYDAGFASGDWEAMRATLAPGCVFEDRRRLALIRGDAELMIASLRERAASGAMCDWTVVGTFGERVAAGRTFWSGGPAGGRFEIEYLGVIEVDGEGRILAIVLFDTIDATAAQREALARWGAIEPGREWLASVCDAGDAWNAKDLEVFGAAFADNLVVNDRRRTGVGHLDREGYLRSTTALWELAPESSLESGWVWLASAPHGGVYAGRRSGTLPDGGEFVSEFLCLLLHERGIVNVLEIFEVDDHEAAVARFAELGRGAG